MAPFRSSFIGAVVVGASALLGCSSSKPQAPETLGTFQAAVVSPGGGTTVGAGTPSTRSATCPDGSLPDQCGSWDGVELVASLTDGDERCLCRAIDFEVPATMPITSGNAGKHKATLSFRKESGALVECKYKGDRLGGRSGGTNGGWQYVFEKCSDNSVAGTLLRADWFSLVVSATDTQVGSGEVKLRLGEPDVVDGVVQEMTFYSSDPRIGEAALHVPRGAAPPNQEFTLTMAEAVPVGASFENGGAPVTSLGPAVDVNATGIDRFVFTPVPGASCPRIELPYDPVALADLDASEQVLQARHVLDLQALLAGQSALEPVGAVDVDLLRHTVSFCVEHLSIYFTIGEPFDSDLTSAVLSPGGQELLSSSELPDVQPSLHYTLTLEFTNIGQTTWKADELVLVAVKRTDNHTYTPELEAVTASPWFPSGAYTSSPYGSNVLANGTATFTVDLVAPAQYTPEAYLNLCLSNPNTAFFGECFSWDPQNTPDTDVGYTAAGLEICDDIDNDLDGQTDEGLPTFTFYRDVDGDNFGAGATVEDCAPPAGFVAAAGDCNDGSPAINPGATEVCNYVDDNCADGRDEGLLVTFRVDGDGDTWCAPNPMPGGMSTAFLLCPWDQLPGTIPESECSFFEDPFGEIPPIFSDCNDSNALADTSCEFMLLSVMRTVDEFTIEPFPVDCGTGWHVSNCQYHQLSTQGGVVGLLGNCAIGEQTADLEVVYATNGDGFLTGWGTVLCRADTTYP